MAVHDPVTLLESTNGLRLPVHHTALDNLVLPFVRCSHHFGLHTRKMRNVLMHSLTPPLVIRDQGVHAMTVMPQKTQRQQQKLLRQRFGHHGGREIVE